MKTNMKLWSRIVLLLIVSAMAVYGVLVSCEKEELQPLQPQILKNDQKVPNELMPLPEICGDIEQRDLKTSGKVKVGDVYIFNDRNNLYVYVYAMKGALVKSAYLYAGSKERIPLTEDMDPNVSRFTFVEYSEQYSKFRKFIIPLSAVSYRFTMSLMVEIKSESEAVDQKDLTAISSEKSNFNAAWAEGMTYGVTNEGKLFMHTLERCEFEHFDKHQK